MSPRAPETPGQKAVRRNENVKLLLDARMYGVPSVVTALVYKELSRRLPALASVSKLNKNELGEAAADGFERAWSEFQASATDPQVE